MAPDEVALVLVVQDPAPERDLCAQLLDGGANPARTDMADPDLRGGTRYLLNLRPIVSNFKKWSDKYDAIIQLGSKR